jgi:hypothetical protein
VHGSAAIFPIGPLQLEESKRKSHYRLQVRFEEITVLSRWDRSRRPLSTFQERYLAWELELKQDS